MRTLPENLHRAFYPWREEVCEHAGGYITTARSHAARYHAYFVGQEQISCRKSDSLDISLDDLHEFCAEEEAFGSFYDDVLSNTRRYVSFFAEAADELMPRRTSDIMDEDDTFDVLLRQRENIEATADDAHGSNEGLPSILRRRFRVYLKPRTKSEMRILRSIRAADIGHLVTFKGICTRAGDVKPLIEVACLTCDSCGFEIYQVF